jgi:biotin carboxyl carrier protein
MAKYKVNVDGKNYEVEVENIGDGNLEIKLGDKKSTVNIEELSSGTVHPSSPRPVYKTPSYTPKAEPVPTPVQSSGNGEPIKAVMAGTVLSIKKKVGDKVTIGDVVLILEAMKMENEISTPSEGVISAIQVNPGQLINTGDTLFTIG